jgi:hypothetical protein
MIINVFNMYAWLYLYNIIVTDVIVSVPTSQPLLV